MKRHFRRSRIVCTIGPATASRKMVCALIRAGMDIARLNFSHGSHADHEKVLKIIRSESQRLGRPVGILLDLQGIKIRTGTLTKSPAVLKKGSIVALLPGKGPGDAKTIYITYPKLARDLRAGHRVLLADGVMELRVLGKKGKGLSAKVIEGGELGERKGVNLPDTRVTLESFTPKDREDLEFGIRHGVDYIAVSFVRRASEMRRIRECLLKRNISIPLIAKIEKPEALDEIEAILAESDGIMVARGDMGVEVSTEDVPMLQKMLIERANHAGKLVITATQMLESMTGHSRPTRAEAADVANAVLDGTDALMLSAETSIGKFPIESVMTMDKIIRAAERNRLPSRHYNVRGDVSAAVAEAAVTAAEDMDARYIVAFTQSGYTARLLSKFRPVMPILAFTPAEEVARRMSLCWGVWPMIMKTAGNTDEMFNNMERMLLKMKLLKPGDHIVITASAPVLGAGKTNLMKIQKVRG